ncbi:MAG: S8 family peptidase [Bacteroidota bacterium]
MKKIFNFLTYFILAIVAGNTIYAQKDTLSNDSLTNKNLNWYNLDHSADKIMGVSADKAYKELLIDKTSKKIIVAVIDGGVDINHEDLKDHIWVNSGEIAGNGIDDDLNGYVDDVNGWNFLGNSKGENIKEENLEYTRMLKVLKPKFKNIKSENEVDRDKVDDYKTYLACKKKYDEKLKEYQTSKKTIDSYTKKLDDAEKTIKGFLQKDTLIEDDVKNITSTGTAVQEAQKFLLYAFENNINRSLLETIRKENNLYLDKYLNFEFSPRSIVGDDPENILDKNYGNNDVKGPDAGHGTMVAGIIGAVRNNGIGINGIADNVELMVLRVVPEGDERDKDVALAIRYAVENGANIINMSFGKAFSPQKQFVDGAIKFAENHNVLLVHAAGNDGLNNDSTEHYPSKIYNNDSIVKTMINVGASGMYANKDFAAFFSNYGQSVDLFAPGVGITSTTPESKYEDANGTSFSCPVVSGVAALVWSYYPQLTAKQLKDVLLESVAGYKKIKVNQPNKESGVKKKKVSFSKLCKTGGEVNAYKALIAANKLINKTDKKK